jgi:pyridinium-3,5-biscarboxylic acid mononucleotide sulfurtransferase
MNSIDKNLLNKYEELKNYIERLGSVAVAFSSGVDSTFLLFASKEALNDNIIAITASSCLFPKRELSEAEEFCKNHKIKHIIVSVNEFEINGFSENPVNRCYLCKKQLFNLFKNIAAENKINQVIEGSNFDDEGDYRPGLMAIKELNIKSPLRELKFTKAEIRTLSKYFNLPTWDKPSFACLASRFPYGEEINEDKINMVDRAEQILLGIGFEQFRVRVHNSNLARIELLPKDFHKFMEDNIRLKIYEELKKIGFNYVSLDIIGYRTGSMNEILKVNLES